MTTLKNGVRLRRIPVSPNDDYRAGSDGQIYSRTRYAGFGRKERTAWYPLKGHRTKKGYRHVSLCHDNVKVTKNVHRLVCMAFHGMPEPKTLQVRHLDGDPSNNSPENLAWGTQEENWHDRRAHGRVNARRRFTEVEREHIRWAVARGLCSRKGAARALGVAQSSIQGICAEAISSG